jgi:acetyl-CoA synthetase
LEQFGVTNAMIPPTALRMMQSVERPAENYDLSLEVIVVSGEKVTADIFEWANRELPDVTINEMYGMTEASGIVSNCQQWFESKPESMGKPVPGQSVAVLDPETLEELPPGETGEIAVDCSRSPTVFEQYWNASDKTAAATTSNWFLTGDLATVDDDGYYWFQNRADNLIISSGYRIAPQDVEETILQHPDVSSVGVVGVPDDVRGTVLKAFIKPTSIVDGDGLETEITDMVREELAAYQYPREIEFVEELPTTSSGKIDRETLQKDA